MGIIGQHSLHKDSNDNGMRLIDYTASRNMVIGSTMFPHKEIHKVTWKSPDGRTFNQMYQAPSRNTTGTSYTYIQPLVLALILAYTFKGSTYDR
jgi:hypothetical protein